MSKGHNQIGMKMFGFEFVKYLFYFMESAALNEFSNLYCFHYAAW